MVMTQKETKYTTTYKLWCLIKPAVTKRVWHEHSYVSPQDLSVYLLFNLFVPLFLTVASEHSALVNSTCSRLEILI